MNISPQQKQALDHIENARGDLKIEQFDEDFEPIGDLLRNDLIDMGLIVEKHGKINKTFTPHQ